MADRPGLRPTPDRVRETLFNWLGQDLTGWRCLDAFAGSGALGFEAASRGAARVLLLEHDGALVRSLRASRERLGLGATDVEIERADALAWMSNAEPAGFELVLLDPPFESALLNPAIQAALPLLVEGGFLYLESGHELPEPAAGASVWRSARAGAVQHALWRRRYTRAAV